MVVKQKVTLEEFLNLSSDWLEFVDGEVVEKVAPDTWHGALTSALDHLLKQHAQAAGYELFIKSRFIFGQPPRAYIPDISLVQRERLEVDARGRPARQPQLPPDLTIEILSPDDRPSRVVQKTSFYMSAGVRLALVVDPGDETVTVVRPSEEPVIATVPGSVELAPVLPGITLDLGELFAALKIDS